MEIYISTTNQSFNGTYGPDHIFFNISLFATYLNIILLLVAMVAVIVPAVLVIRIILQTEKLHTIYYLFVINLLGTNILNTLRLGFEIILMCFYLFSINVDTNVSFIIYAILNTPRTAVRFTFITLAIDRVVAVAFPYRHRSIMTYKRAYIMIILTWIISSIVALAVYLTSSLAFVGPFGAYIPVEKSIVLAIFYPFLLVLTIILIICINVYLYVQINKSKRKFEENMRTHGGNDNNEIKQLNNSKATYYKFKKQVKITLSLLVLGGVDGILNLLLLMILPIIRFLLLLHPVYLFQFVVNPLFCVQMISHSLVYGIYMKDIRRRLCKCQLYQRLRRKCPLCPSKVIVLHRSK